MKLFPFSIESTVSLQFLSSMFFFPNFAGEKFEIAAKKLQEFLHFFLFFFGNIPPEIAFPCHINRISSAARRPIVLSTKCKIRDTSFGNDVSFWWND